VSQDRLPVQGGGDVEQVRHAPSLARLCRALLPISRWPPAPRSGPRARHVGPGCRVNMDVPDARRPDTRPHWPPHCRADDADYRALHTGWR
jgi:hypothetical protein